MDTVYITKPWLLLFIAAVIALHAVPHFITRLRLPLTFVNIPLHAAAAAAIIMAGGEIEDFLLLLLISGFSALAFGHLEEKKNADNPTETKEATRTKEAVK